MKLLLINPPRWNELVGKNPSIIEKHRGFNPPLGLLYLAASLQKQTTFEVEILDTQPLELSYRQLEDVLSKKSFDVVGVTAMTFTLFDAVKTIRIAKKVHPNAWTVLGGTHVHLFPEETANLNGVDFALMGEAEYSLIALLSLLNQKNNTVDSIPGLIYKSKEGKININNIVPITDLDALPFPRRSVLDIHQYNSLLSHSALSTTIISSRGCPFRCAFCDRPCSPVTSLFRVRSAQNVVDEIQECVDLGIKDFLFYDDTFTVVRERILSICDELLHRGIHIRWDIRTRVDLVDRQVLEMLKKAGCQSIHYGVESGSDRILKIIKKGITVKKAKDIFALTRKIGIDTLAYFMIGLPSETASDIQKTCDLVKELHPDYVHFSIFSPYPGTELYALGMERNIIKQDIWREFARNPQEGFQIPVWEENFTRDDLYKTIVTLYKGFYLRPVYLLTRLAKTRSLGELMRKAKAGISVATMKKEGVDKVSR